MRLRIRLVPLVLASLVVLHPHATSAQPAPTTAPITNKVTDVLDLLKANPSDANLLVWLQNAIKTEQDPQEKTRGIAAYSLGCLLLNKNQAAQQAVDYLRKNFPASPYVSQVTWDNLSRPCSLCGGNGSADKPCARCKGNGTCISCNGAGSVQGISGPIRCAECHGTGKCRDCNGTGTVRQKCSRCGGTGTVFDRSKAQETYTSILREKEVAEQQRQEAERLRREAAAQEATAKARQAEEERKLAEQQAQTAAARARQAEEERKLAQERTALADKQGALDTRQRATESVQPTPAENASHGETPTMVVPQNQPPSPSLRQTAPRTQDTVRSLVAFSRQHTLLIVSIIAALVLFVAFVTSRKAFRLLVGPIAALLLVYVVLSLRSGCAGVSDKNYQKVKTGMTYDEVVSILGKPTDAEGSASVQADMGPIGQYSVSQHSWQTRNTMIIIQFHQGRVAIMSKASIGSVEIETTADQEVVPQPGKITKEQWWAKFNENHMNLRVGYNAAYQGGTKDEFIRIMGKPDKTQAVGGQVYWYYYCSDGQIQMVLKKGNLEFYQQVYVDDINEY